MALNWNIEKVKNWKEISDDEEEWKVTDALIWATMAVGLGSITKANAEEFHRRLSEYEHQFGTYLILKGGEPYYITLADVQRRIGLYTNVGNTSKREFAAKLKRLAQV